MNKAHIETIRDFNRFYTTVLGVVNSSILDSDFSLTEARIIYEVYHHKGITARELKEKLVLDEGYMSRISKKLVKEEILARKQSAGDKRIFGLELTGKGKKAFAVINRQSDRQVEQLVAHLGLRQQSRLAALIGEVKQLLTPAKV